MKNTVDGGASSTTEPAAGSSTGTDVSLRDYTDVSLRAVYAAVAALEVQTKQRLDLNDTALTAALTAQEKAVAAALTAAKEAVDKAELAASKRFESTNEFRGQLADQAATFQRADVAGAQNELFRSQINDLNKKTDTAAGRYMGALAAATLMISIIVVLTNLVIS